jgi:hypothetical protein
MNFRKHEAPIADACIDPDLINAHNELLATAKQLEATLFGFTKPQTEMDSQTPIVVKTLTTQQLDQIQRHWNSSTGTFRPASKNTIRITNFNGALSCAMEFMVDDETYSIAVSINTSANNRRSSPNYLVVTFTNLSTNKSFKATYHDDSHVFLNKKYTESANLLLIMLNDVLIGNTSSHGFEHDLPIKKVMSPERQVGQLAVAN